MNKPNQREYQALLRSDFCSFAMRCFDDLAREAEVADAA